MPQPSAPIQIARLRQPIGLLIGTALGAALLTPGLAAEPAPFELTGPDLKVSVTRGTASLPISQVPSLRAGDKLLIEPNLPKEQGANFVLMSAFLRGATNPPPKDWIDSAETWKKKDKDRRLALTVPDGARQMVLFLVPETGGGEGTVSDAVRGKPGEFVRATQELNQASLDRSRLDAFMTAIRTQENSHPEFLRSVAPALARSLSMKLNEDCLSKVIELQAACLLENKDQLVLADVHSSSIAETLSGTPTDLALQLASTREAGYGYYSPYIGVVRDLARMFGAFSSPSFEYLPTVSLRRDDNIGLMLNKAPSFAKPKSVMVVGMPSIEADSPPRLRSGAQAPICAALPGTVLPVEGAPLIYSTSYARGMTVQLKAASGQTIEYPLEARADRGGYVIRADGPWPADFRGSIEAHVYGQWGFDRFEGPDYILQRPDDAAWQVKGEAPTLVVGRDNGLTLTGGAPSCVESVTLRQGNAAPQAIGWKVQGRDALDLTLPLADRRAGPVTVDVKYQGVAKPFSMALRAYAQASKLDGLTVHQGDAWGEMTGQRLDQVASVDLGGRSWKPDGLTRDGSVDRLRLTAAGDGTVPAEGASARVQLEDGRTVSVPVTIAPARPRVTLLNKSVTPAATTGLPVTLGGSDVLPNDGRLIFSVQAQDGTKLAMADAIEVATQDGGASVRLTAGSGLQLQSPQVMVATLDPAALGPAFGPLQFRIVRGREQGDWQPLMPLARLPRIEAVDCAGKEQKDQGCTIKGRDLFLVDAVAGNPAFDQPAPVAQGFTGSTLTVPAPTDGKLYVRLRDAQGAMLVVQAPSPAA
ncbi:hypothetical protein [Sphingobium sp.]|jgi:hypothetical protein|uniref:hypothetical protein n=1 Tax=Sphingobium sp. TaxID=1912891 RepID=UPI00257A5FEE|nr:hypothetical protein [Sphingobium sp.]MBR2267494.1 hypothetical protein [Sphingobium sp.]